MNILINCPSKFDIKNGKSNNKIGGIESLNIVLAKKLSNINYNVTLSSICNKKTKIKKLTNLPIKHIKLKNKKLNFDLIISSNDAEIFNHFPKSKKILWLHNPLQIEKSIRKKQFLSLLIHRPKAIFVSTYLESITSKLFFFKEKIIIPNFLLPNFISHKINFKRKKIFVWSVQRSKGLGETIEMWSNDISPFYKDAELHIFGLNKLPIEYNKKILQSKRIFFKGRVSKNVLKNIYNRSLAMICLGYDETFCLNALEANSCGLPIVTFGETALNDFVINNYNGFVAKNYLDMSSIIIKMINIGKIKQNKLIINSVTISKKYHLKKIINYWLKIL
jgi:glycosyltransferase involved in cell wall biosynthesis